MTGAADGGVPAAAAANVLRAMVCATAAATIVGFWLSYDGLHAFALHAGLQGPAAWAWPASVDLFILTGEAGVTAGALRGRRIWSEAGPWVYLALGFGASVTANVLHVDPTPLAWTRYAAAAVPPVAAMLALAALLRQAYTLTADRAAAERPASHRRQAVAAAAATVARGTRGHSGPPAVTLPPRPQPADVQAILPLMDPPVTGSKLGTLTGKSARTGRRLLRLADSE